jgi:hypothetical protein
MRSASPRAEGMNLFGPVLLGLNAFDIDFGNGVDAKGQFEVQPRLCGLDIAAEALNNPNLVLVDGVKGRKNQEQRRNDGAIQRPAGKLHLLQYLNEVISLRRHTAPGGLMLSEFFPVPTHDSIFGFIQKMNGIYSHIA